MPYQVLARKWRPKSFSELKGQEHVTRALTNAINRGELHHAYLFTGTRGVGKTTIARVLAKCLNCQQGVTSTPCGECSACIDIDSGRFVDLIEVDAASRTRVEDTRELLENVQYAPTQGRFKIYLIDEVHMLSGHSFNALLKTLEEPPPHVKFILATTDPERIPITVLSRCLRFGLRALSAQDITAQLQNILTTENITYEIKALSKIAQAAQGSMRDALSILEQAIAYSNGSLNLSDVEEMLGVTYQRHIPVLLTALFALDVKRCLEIVETMAVNGADFTAVMSSLLSALHAIAIAQTVQGEDIAQFAQVEETILQLKDALEPEEVQLLYQIALMGQKDMQFAPSERVGLEMALLRMVVFRPQEPSQKSALTVSSVKVPLQTAVPTPRLAPVTKEVLATSQAPAWPLQTEDPQQVSKPESVQKTQEVPSILDWPNLIGKLGLSALTLMLVKHCVVAKWDGQKLALTLDDAQKACLNPQRQDQIQAALSQHFGYPVKLSITIGNVDGKSPVLLEQAAIAAREKEVKESIAQNKGVQSLVSTFGASIEKITILEPPE